MTSACNNDKNTKNTEEQDQGKITQNIQMSLKKWKSCTMQKIIAVLRKRNAKLLFV